jgi:hypothetical protein
MELIVNHEHHGTAMLRAELALIQTRSLGEKDHVCSNEATYYPPLTQLAHSMPAVLTDMYSGPGLGISWNLHGKRSAFVGAFAQ